MRKVLDEREQIIRLKIASGGFVIITLALAVSMFIKAFIFEMDSKYYITESILVLFSCFYYGISCGIKGIDVKSAKNYTWKKQAAVTAVALICCLFIAYFVDFIKGEMPPKGEVFAFALSFIVSFVIAQRIFIYFRKKRAETLSKRYDE
ncbi:hypothetical protein NE664_06670 [Anaerotignum faecicola]|nr:hypothetical protein [Anaerotignum faecicola]